MRGNVRNDSSAAQGETRERERGFCQAELTGSADEESGEKQSNGTHGQRIKKRETERERERERERGNYCFFLFLSLSLSFGFGAHTHTHIYVYTLSVER
jgi:hypothetical protein